MKHKSIKSFDDYIMNLSDNGIRWCPTPDPTEDIAYLKPPKDVIIDIMREYGEEENMIIQYANNDFNEFGFNIYVHNDKKIKNTFLMIWIYGGCDYDDFTISKKAERHLMNICNTSYQNQTKNGLKLTIYRHCHNIA